VVGGERVDAGGDALALVERVLGNQQMLVGPPATCGACVTAITWTCSASRDSRAPIASATAPPTPVSISSNPAWARAAVGQHHLERQQDRDSSPPEATFISGPGLVPGLICTQNSTRSIRAAPASSIGLDLGREFCALELQRREFGVDRLVELLGGLVAGRRQLVAAALALVGLGRGGFSFSIDPPRHRSARRRREFGGERRQPSTGVEYLREAARSANSTLDALQLGRSRNRRDQGRAEILVGLFQRVDRDIDRLTAGSTSAGELAARRSRRRTAAASAGTGE
jgi:hypothetical protein